MKALQIEHQIKICTYDIDFAGHVSNIAYLRWLEEMRLKMFDTFCPLENFIKNGVSPILLGTDIRYKRSLRLFDRPCARMWLADVGKVSLDIECEIFLDEVLTTTARHQGVFVELASGKPIRVPREFMDCVSRYEARRGAHV